MGSGEGGGGGGVKPVTHPSQSPNLYIHHPYIIIDDNFFVYFCRVWCGMGGARQVSTVDGVVEGDAVHWTSRTMRTLGVGSVVLEVVQGFSSMMAKKEHTVGFSTVFFYSPPPQGLVQPAWIGSWKHLSCYFFHFF